MPVEHALKGQAVRRRDLRRRRTVARRQDRADPRIEGTCSGAGRCQTYRAVNGSATSPVAITYRYSRAVAENRASNAAGASDARRTTSSGPSSALTPSRIRSGPRLVVVANDV